MKIELRLLESGDAEAAARWRNDSVVWTHTAATGRTNVISADTERAWIEQVLRNPAERRCAILADGRHIGNVYLTDILDGAAQFHIFIGDRGMWGRGVGRRATAQMLKLGWRELGLRHIHLSVHRENTAALSLYRGLGFTEEGQVQGETFVRMVAANPDNTDTGG